MSLIRTVCTAARPHTRVSLAQLRPTVAYLYAGQAARTALAIGLNRAPVNRESRDQQDSLLESKTWW